MSPYSQTNKKHFMENTNSDNQIVIKNGSTFLKLEKLKDPFFRLLECSNNIAHKPGALVVAVTNSSGIREFCSFSSDQATGVEYIPEGTYDWDKLSLDEIGIINGTDKSSTKHNYLAGIDAHLSKKYDSKYRTNQPTKILEIGICNGASMRTFARAFPNSTITGIDISPDCSKLCQDLDNINIIIDDATKPTCLKSDQKFDLIIDDGSHDPSDALESFQFLFERHLLNNGTYIIEDIDCFYNPEYAKKQSSTIENFQHARKNLLDDLVFGSIRTKRKSAIKSIHIFDKIIVIDKN